MARKNPSKQGVSYDTRRKEVEMHIEIMGGIALNWTFVEEATRFLLARYITPNRRIGKFITHNMNSSQMGEYLKVVIRPEKSNRRIVKYVQNSYSTNRQNRNKVVHSLRADEDFTGTILYQNTNPFTPAYKIPISNEKMADIVLDINDLKKAILSLVHWKLNNKDDSLIKQLGELRVPQALNPPQNLPS